MKAAIGTVAGAIMFGLAGGYAWSAMSAGTGDRPDPTLVEASVHYSGCNEVRALGRAPIYAGQPGYRSDMDGDGDGIACEPIRG